MIDVNKKELKAYEVDYWISVLKEGGVFDYPHNVIIGSLSTSTVISSSTRCK